MGLAQANANTAGTERKQPPDALAALLKLGRPLVMGILNVTPDSFSDGGQFLDSAAAIAHAGAMAGQGADILDIGAESTRPYGGAQPVSADDERARLAPVLPAAVKLGLPVSIDTIKAGVAAWALPLVGDPPVRWQASEATARRTNDSCGFMRAHASRWRAGDVLGEWACDNKPQGAADRASQALDAGFSRRRGA